MGPSLLDSEGIIFLDKLDTIMSSYALVARLSNLEGGASDLQTDADTLNANNRNTITNTLDVERQAQAVSDGVSLNKIGIQDDTLEIETSTKVILLGINKEKIQAKLTPISDATNSKAVLSGNTVRSTGFDDTLSARE